MYCKDKDTSEFTPLKQSCYLFIQLCSSPNKSPRQVLRHRFDRQQQKCLYRLKELSFSHATHTDPLLIPKVSVFSGELWRPLLKNRNSHKTAGTQFSWHVEKYIVGHQVDFQAWEIEKQCKQEADDNHKMFNTWRNMKYQLSDLNHISLLNINLHDNNKNKHSSWRKSN